LSSRLEDQRAGYCRHCGDRLPLIKRVKREEFCSEEHRGLFLSSTQIVALDRLRETDAQMQAAPQLEPEADHSMVAVAELPIDTTPEPPDPPMAGTIGPTAVDRPLRLVTLFDGDSHSIGGLLWEPVRPEPQWHGLALRFGLAEFHESSPEPIGEESSELLRVMADQVPADLPAELALPRNVSQLVPDLSPEETLELFSGDVSESNDDQVPAGVSTFIVATALPIQRMAAHRMAPMAEALELDTMLYLPGFSPRAELESLGDRGWALAEWMACSGPVEPQKMAAAQPEAIEAGEPLQAEIPIEPLLESGCHIVPVEVPSEPEAEPDLEAEPEPELPAFVTASNDLDEYALEGGSADTSSTQAGAEPVPAQIDWEERGMSEAVQNRTDQGSLPGLQALGERIANPFLHEPQPRPGSGTPRWTPATAELGTSAPLASEDWDIL
jgi:hypothetical protein